MTTRSLVQAMSELVRPEVQVPGLVLEEHDTASRCPPVRLSKQGRSLLLRPDARLHDCDRPDCHAKSGGPNERLFPLFVPHREGLTSLCDYLLFYEPRRDRPATVFLLELKSGRPHDARRQLYNGKLLAEYLVAMTVLHGDTHHDPHVELRGIVFTPRAPGPKPVFKGYRFQFFPDLRFPDLKIAHLAADQPWDLDALCAG